MLFVGYQSEGTFGRSLVDGAKSVTIFGEKIAVNAEIATLSGASGHADKIGLKKWADSFKKRPDLVFVNHGEDSACQSFRDQLHDELGYEAVAPYSGTQYDLLTGEPVVLTKGVPIPHKKSDRDKNTPKTKKARRSYDDLQNAVNALSRLSRDSVGRTNADLSKLTRKINALIEEFKL